MSANYARRLVDTAQVVANIQMVRSRSCQKPKMSSGPWLAYPLRISRPSGPAAPVRESVRQMYKQYRPILGNGNGQAKG